jgi:hypothetical protein
VPHCGQIIDMPWDWPVEVNYHEAKAFLKWKGEQDRKSYRLPTVSADDRSHQPCDSRLCAEAHRLCASCRRRSSTCVVLSR